MLDSSQRKNSPHFLKIQRSIVNQCTTYIHALIECFYIALTPTDEMFYTNWTDVFTNIIHVYEQA